MVKTASPGRIPRVVVACDDSLTSIDLVAAATRVADRLGAALAPVRVRARASVGVRRAVEPAGRAVGSLGTLPVVEGIPAIEIIRFAESRGADFVVLDGGHPRAPAADGLRTLADSVVRRAEVPCLVLPVGQARLARLVVALDGSDRGMRALRTAWDLRGLADGEISAILVEPGYGGLAGRREHANFAGDLLGRQGASVMGPEADIRVFHRHGDVVDQVLDGLSAGAGDLLVVGVRRGGPADVAESTGNGRRLLAAAPCAVLTVPL
jgi:nucleotide-binding universal stress UspA family protein